VKRLEVKLGSVTYGVSAVGEKLIITKRHEGHEEDGTSIIIDRHALKVLAQWVELQEMTRELEETYR
jgi:hypothetical protein